MQKEKWRKLTDRDTVEMITRPAMASYINRAVAALEAAADRINNYTPNNEEDMLFFANEAAVYRALAAEIEEACERWDLELRR